VQILMKYRAKKLREYIVGMEAEEKVLLSLVNSCSSIPTYYVDKLLDTKKQLAIFRMRLDILTDRITHAN